MSVAESDNWVCICKVCGRPASWYISPQGKLADSWRWYCKYLDCDNDRHAVYEDKIFKVIPKNRSIDELKDI